MSCKVSLLRVQIAQLTLAQSLLARRSFIALRTASTRAAILGNSLKSTLILRYALKTSSVSTRLFRPAVSLIALTAIQRMSSLSIQQLNSSLRIVKACQSSACKRLTLPTAQQASTSICLHIAPIIVARFLNSSNAKLVPRSCTMQLGSPQQTLIQHLHSASQVSRADINLRKIAAQNKVSMSTIQRASLVLICTTLITILQLK